MYNIMQPVQWIGGVDHTYNGMMQGDQLCGVGRYWRGVVLAAIGGVWCWPLLEGCGVVATIGGM